MNTFEGVYFMIMAAIFIVFITFIITSGTFDTDHEYWLNGEIERIDNAIEMLIENPSDSLIVTHPNNPYLTGVVKFERK